MLHMNNVYDKVLLFYKSLIIIQSRKQKASVNTKA